MATKKTKTTGTKPEVKPSKKKKEVIKKRDVTVSTRVVPYDEFHPDTNKCNSLTLTKLSKREILSNMSRSIYEGRREIEGDLRDLKESIAGYNNGLQENLLDIFKMIQGIYENVNNVADKDETIIDTRVSVIDEDVDISPKVESTSMTVSYSRISEEAVHYDTFIANPEWLFFEFDGNMFVHMSSRKSVLAMNPTMTFATYLKNNWDRLYQTYQTDNMDIVNEQSENQLSNTAHPLCIGYVLKAEIV